ncbi:hypothetical protein [Flavobacterium eburneipallidum]|uniref:hypothetical protein n=1 Tax=Flavobacterium eburneipallidum TaxID=3003263 RepID=UPI0024829A56|nr:hypothetical protein [Flavobacterium eburneipallidum]
MNKFFIYTIIALRKLYSKIFNIIPVKPECEQNPDKASQIIYDALMSDKPCMIARFGSNELNALMNYQSVKSKTKSVFKFIRGEQFDWWWNEGIIKCLHEVAGFFPPTPNKIGQFCELMLQDIPEVDILGSWIPNERFFDKELENAKKIQLRLLEPYWALNHWSRALKGKKVLVVHPFAKDIEQQYQKRKLLFKTDVLPDFQLTTIKAVQSLADEKTEFQDWFEALEFMKTEIDKVDYDICLIGCGAYGFSLAAHVKRMGKKGFHYGGALQLLFGIRGKRWEDPNYGVEEWGIPQGFYANLMNEHWIRPGNKEIPKNAEAVEGACYW